VRSLTRLKPRTETDPDTATRNKGWASVHNVAYPIASSAELQLTLFSPVHCAAVPTRPPLAHPLKAIGIVATIIVLGSAMLVKEAWTVL